MSKGLLLIQFLIVVELLFWTCSPALDARVIISEFMALNRNTLLDEDGDASDWIELENIGSAVVNLDGWYLTDDPIVLAKWRLPASALEPGEFLVIFASGKNRALPGAPLHTNFRLEADGEFLALVEPDGFTIASHFAPFPLQREDISFGIGAQTRPDAFLEAGASGRALVPANDTLGLSWTGGNEPFNDAAAGWLSVTTGLGYPQGEAGDTLLEPLGYWDFDRSGTDQSGHGHTATINGASFSNSVPAEIGTGSSLDFDGNDDFVSAEIDVSEGRFSSSMWLRANTGGRGIFTVVDGDLGAGGFDRLLYLQGGNIAARVWNNETIVSRGLNLADRQWHHIAHVVGGGGQRLYVDGVIVASGSKASSDFDWQQRINIGFSNDGAGDYFDGLIDDVSVWSEALTTEEVRKLAAGASPLALEGVSPLVTTDVEMRLRDVSASIYVRLPFTASLPVDFEALQLHMLYEDGYVAYLNGVEVVRRNAPANLRFDSAATLDRPAALAVRREIIDLTEQLGLLREGVNILAFHGLNDSPTSADFLLLPELVKVTRQPDRYLTEPTPGSPNGAGRRDFVADTKFSINRGLFIEPFSVEITTATEEAEIFYTTDGSEPSSENPAASLYTGPITISTTTSLRAAAFREDFEPTNVDTHTYIFINHVRNQSSRPPGLPTTWSGNFPADYAVDPDVVTTTLPGYGLEDALLSIPTVSLVTDPVNLFDPARGIYYNSQGRGPSWEPTASMELIYPDGEDGFQEEAGLRMHGNSSRNHGFTPKHPIRVLFKEKHGARKLRFPLFGIEEFDQLLLRGASTDSWPVVDGGSVLGVQRWSARHATYMRDQFMRDTQLAMGQPSADGTYVHLFLNGLYWGLYNLAERPTESFCADHLGGDKEEYDVLKDFAELRSGTREAWNAMIAQANAGLASEAAYQRIQGNNPDGTRNPALPRYLDVDNLIDYMILHIHAGAEDWPNHNWWAARRRGPESDGFKFFVWDQEISNDSLVRTHTLFQTRFEQPISAPSPSFLYGRLMANASYRQKFIDRVHRHLFNDGLLTGTVSSERWLARQLEIDRAMVGESARWGDSKKVIPYKREVEWLDEMNWMHEVYWPGLHPIALERFRRVGLYPDVEAPVFYIDGALQHGGHVSHDALLGIVVPSLKNFIDTAFVSSDNRASALVPVDDRLGADWRLPGYEEGSRGELWTAGTNGVGFDNGSDYDALIKIDVSAAMSGADGNPTVYVRLPFTIPDVETLRSFESLTLRVLVDDGFIAYLNGIEVAAMNSPAEPTWNVTATAGTEADPDQPLEIDITSHAGELRVGENLLALHGMNLSPFSSDMIIHAELLGRTIDPAPPPGVLFYTLDGGDPMAPDALEYTGPVPITETVVVMTRAWHGNEWSAMTETIFIDETALPLRITEIMYHPDLPELAGATPSNFEFIELQNIGSRSIDLAGIVLGGGIEFDFSSGEVTTLPPLGHVLVVKNLAAFKVVYDTSGMLIAGEYTGRLENNGEALYLDGPIGERLLECTYDDTWYPETDGAGHSLVIVDPSLDPDLWSTASSWMSSQDPGGSPGTSDPGQVPIGGWLRPGDANQDGALDLSDAVRLLLWLFEGTDMSLPCGGDSLEEGNTLAILDADGDRGVTIADVISILNYLFKNGPPHALGGECIRLEGCEGSCRS